MPDRFPYVYEAERGVPWYLRSRAEGQSVLSGVVHAPAYMLKASRMKRSAAADERAYFEVQRQLQQALMQLDEPMAETAAERVALAAVGDLMWIRSGWDNFLDPDVLACLNRAEVVLGNLESVVSTRYRVPRILPDHLRFNSDPRLVTSFTRPGGGSTFSALSVTNNHMLDYGERGLLDTLDLLDRIGIPHSGVRQDGVGKPYVLFERSGVRFGFTAFSWGLNAQFFPRRTRLRLNAIPGLTERTDRAPDLSELTAALDGMRQDGAEFRIAYLHWGHEYEFYPSPRQMHTARAIVAAGADLIVGSHPHVPQPDEVLFVNGYEKRYLSAGQEVADAVAGSILDDPKTGPRKALVMYSLGNFATAMRNTPCDIGVIDGIEIIRRPAGEVDWRLTHHPNRQLVRNRGGLRDGTKISLLPAGQSFETIADLPPARGR